MQLSLAFLVLPTLLHDPPDSSSRELVFVGATPPAHGRRAPAPTREGGGPSSGRPRGRLARRRARSRALARWAQRTRETELLSLSSRLARHSAAHQTMRRWRAALRPVADPSSPVRLGKCTSSSPAKLGTEATFSPAAPSRGQPLCQTGRFQLLLFTPPPPALHAAGARPVGASVVPVAR